MTYEGMNAAGFCGFSAGSLRALRGAGDCERDDILQSRILQSGPAGGEWAGHMPDTPLGLIAGEGIFPLLVARGARAAGRKVVCVALRGSAWPELRAECDDFHWVGILRFN